MQRLWQAVLQHDALRGVYGSQDLRGEVTEGAGRRSLWDTERAGLEDHVCPAAQTQTPTVCQEPNTPLDHLKLTFNNTNSVTS